MQAQTKHFLLFPVKLIEYIFSAETVCSNPCVRPLSRIKIYFFLLLIFVDEPISTRKIIAFLSGPPLGEEGGGGSPCLSSPIPHPEYLYLSISRFLFKVLHQTKNSLVLDNC